jgi:hypothetical protein
MTIKSSRLVRLVSFLKPGVPSTAVSALKGPMPKYPFPDPADSCIIPGIHSATMFLILMECITYSSFSCPQISSSFATLDYRV